MTPVQSTNKVTYVSSGHRVYCSHYTCPRGMAELSWPRWLVKYQAKANIKSLTHTAVSCMFTQTDKWHGSVAGCRISKLYIVWHHWMFWKVQDSIQTKDRKYSTHIMYNSEKANNGKTQQNKTILVQPSHATLNQETRWAYSTTLASLHGTSRHQLCASTVRRKVCWDECQTR